MFSVNKSLVINVKINNVKQFNTSPSVANSDSEVFHLA